MGLNDCTDDEDNLVFKDQWFLTGIKAWEKKQCKLNAITLKTAHHLDGKIKRLMKKHISYHLLLRSKSACLKIWFLKQNHLRTVLDSN